MASAASVAAQMNPRPAWDAPARSAPQERFFRELMGQSTLPSAPEIAQRLMVTVNRETARIDDLAKLIARDQSLALRLLSLANSAFFALRCRVTSIPHAVTLLGFQRVRDLALGLSVWGALDRSDPAGRRYRRRLWIHTSTVAAAAKLLAERTGGDGNTAFAAGLLHDVGKLVLGLRLKETYWSMIEEAAANGETVADIETQALGCHHGTVGAWLLQLWQLPPEIVDPVARHHDPLEPEFGFDVTAAVAVANRLVDATDPNSGLARQEVLSEIRAFVPGLVGTDEWQAMYADLAREQQAVSSIFAVA